MTLIPQPLGSITAWRAFIHLKMEMAESQGSWPRFLSFCAASRQSMSFTRTDQSTASAFAWYVLLALYSEPINLTKSLHRAQADTQRNIAPLATFLRDQAEKTASRLLDICEADTDPDGDVDGGLDTFIGKEYEKAVATGPVSLSP